MVGTGVVEGCVVVVDVEVVVEDGGEGVVVVSCTANTRMNMHSGNPG